MPEEFRATRPKTLPVTYREVVRRLPLAFAKERRDGAVERVTYGSKYGAMRVTIEVERRGRVEPIGTFELTPDGFLESVQSYRLRGFQEVESSPMSAAELRRRMR